MIYDQYHRLCQFRRGLKKLANGKQHTAHDRFRFLDEIKSLDARIKALERTLSIEVVGDWEFSNLAVNYVFRPPAMLSTEDVEKQRVAKIRASMRRSYNTPEYREQRRRYRAKLICVRNSKTNP